MSLTKTALHKLATKAHKSGGRTTCAAHPDRPGRRCGRTVKPGNATCGRNDCGLWMLSLDEADANRLLET